MYKFLSGTENSPHDDNNFIIIKIIMFLFSQDIFFEADFVKLTTFYL